MEPAPVLIFDKALINFIGRVSHSESSELVLGFHRPVLLPGTLLAVCESLPFRNPTSLP